MPSETLAKWTLDELVHELRARSRRKVARRPAASSLRAVFPASSQQTADRLDVIPASVLVQEVAGRQRAIYGTDDRRDLHQVSDPAILTAAASVATLARPRDLEPITGGFKLRTTSYRDDFTLCPEERFASQPLGCFCSGFLVAPDVIATAGHCVSTTLAAKRIRYVFGFRMLSNEQACLIFSDDDVYVGAELIGRRFSEGGQDWALVRLDRPVVGRQPLLVRKSGKVAEGQPLFVIGHPNGLPTKYAGGAKVRDNRPATYFVANLDTYGGNSGSPVFNAETHVVEGVLSRGETDFVRTGSGCWRSLVCPNSGCIGEDVTRAAVWIGRIVRR